MVEVGRTRERLCGPAIEVVARKDGSALSFAEQRLWFLDQLVPGSAFYNIASAWRLEGPLDAAALEAALGEVVARHESLRTTFVSVDGKPLQRVKEPWAFELTAVDVSGEPCPEEAASLQVAEEAARPFDLARGPLLRAQLLRLSDEDHVLILVVHHIVSDGWSSGVLWREIVGLVRSLYRGEAVAASSAVGAICRFRSLAAPVARGRGVGRAAQVLACAAHGAPPALELPADRPRPPMPSFEGGACRFVV